MTYRFSHCSIKNVKKLLIWDKGENSVCLDVSNYCKRLFSKENDSIRHLLQNFHQDSRKNVKICDRKNKKEKSLTQLKTSLRRSKQGVAQKEESDKELKTYFNLCFLYCLLAYYLMFCL